MSATPLRPERPGYASPGQSAATPWVHRPRMGISPVGAKQPFAPAPAPPGSWCRPFRAMIFFSCSPRALPWAGIGRPVGASVSDTVLAGHYGFTAEELDFILNYDIKYRLGRSTEEEED